jgi:hypothetical protein
VRRRRALLVLTIIGGLMLANTPSASGTQSRDVKADRTAAILATCNASYCWHGEHTDVLARFASGRTITAKASVQENRSTLQVRAYMEIWATGTSGNRVPGIYTVKDFHFKRYRCSAINVCNPVQPPYTKCGTACEIRTTAANPTAVIVGSVWRPGNLYHAWRTVSDAVDGVILNTSDNIQGTKCVSSYLVQSHPGYSESGAPTC